MLRAAGVDVRRVPKIGFDPFADMRDRTATQQPVVFDVGANRGQTIAQFRRAFARPVIHAFEPARETFAELQRRCASIPDLVLNDAALGARAESRTFVESDDSEMSSLLEPSADAWGEIKNRYEVDVITLDDYCESRRIGRIDILKTDTQGFDMQVLVGAERLLRASAVHLIYTEVIFSDMYRGLPRFDETYAFLADRGFKLVSFYDFYYQNGRASWTDALFIA
jgi:FkbM family methyltransferase